MRKHRLAQSVRTLTTALILTGCPAISFGAISGTFVNNGDGTVTYSYVVDNSAGSFDVSAWSLEFGFTSPDWNQLDALSGGDVAIPNPAWFADAGVPVTGLSAQDFLSLDPAADVQLGQSLSGFSFTSHHLPDQVAFSEFSANGASSTGTTIGPGLLLASNSVPDSGVTVVELAATMMLFAAGARVQPVRA